MSVVARLTDADLRFVAATLLPDRDPRRTVERLRENPEALEELLEDDRLLERLRSGDALVRVTPWLLFSVLLRRVRRELRTAPYTVERLGTERVPVFDARRAGDLLADPQILDYLVEMLVSFTRTDSFLLEVEEGGRVRRRRFSDFDSEDMIALAALMPDELRFPILRRVADIALFITGIFPEHVDPLARPPGAAAPPASRWRFRRTLEEYEEEGRRFYRLAASHRMARRLGMERPLEALAEMFPLARKPLNVLASQYIGTSRFVLFGGAG
ncbi:MAG: hypothetical protein QN155_01425 [Armatimonadota bacterium]|nr:hypothetical protein [Armatimonadota bacterium]MDR7404207.1 hypothetical protein [Armatimonadota bacterium]